MDIEEIVETDVWQLYEQGRDYCRLINMYSDTDKNYRFYNGNQWAGLKVSGIEPVQLNFIKPIVKYKIGIINSNLWAINYSSQNFENKAFRPVAEKTCELLNKKAAKVWEKDNLDLKLRRVSKDSAINDLGVLYTTYDVEEQTPITEIIAKNDIYFGNENDGDIQRQPYILIKQRRSVAEIVELARKEGVGEDKIKYILGDSDYFEESGESAKIEKDHKCTLVTKFYKKDGTVWYTKATRYAEIVPDTNSGLTYYPIAAMPWEEKEGSARGEGEVRYLIPNQIEVNKTIMRRLITVKQTAYPQKVARMDKIQNPSALNEVGGTIKVYGADVQDVNKVVTNIDPAQMSADVEKVQNELIQISRDLAGAGDIATGDVDPEDASGKAILAVQQASQQPLVEQLGALKSLIEDLARIWLDMFTVYSESTLTLEEEVTDPNTGEKSIELVEVPVSILQELKASVKVDVTPKGAFDKYAQEVSLENLLKAGYFNVERLPELKLYVELLDDDSVMPKQKLEEAIELMEAEQRKIALINAQAQIMQQNANQFLNQDIEAQASTINEAQMQIEAERQATAQDRNAIAEEREDMAEEREEVVEE
jgi:hypothetical protein